MQITLRQLRDIYFEDSDYQDGGKFVKVEEGEWKDDGKYQSCKIIFKDTTTDKHYSYWVSRSGSYFSEWYYDQFDYNLDGKEEVSEVKLQEVIIKKWMPIKNKHKSKIM